MELFHTAAYMVHLSSQDREGQDDFPTIQLLTSPLYRVQCTAIIARAFFFDCHVIYVIPVPISNTSSLTILARYILASHCLALLISI